MWLVAAVMPEPVAVVAEVDGSGSDGVCDFRGDRFGGCGWVVGSGDGSADHEYVGTASNGLRLAVATRP